MCRFFPSRSPRFLAALTTALLISAVAAQRVRAETPFDELLPDDTLAVVRVSDFKELRARWSESQAGRLMADPAMKPFVDAVLESLEELGTEFQKEAGLSLRELWQLPQGEAALAVRGLGDGKADPSVVVLLHVGEHVEKTRELLDRVTTKLVEAGHRRKVEQVQGTDLTVLEPPEDKKADDKTPGLVWGLRDAVLIAATDLPTASDLIGRWDGGAERTLARKPSYRKVVERTGENAQVHFYVDAAALVTLLTKSLADTPTGLPVDQIFKLVGLDSVRSVGGGVAIGQGKFDAEVKLLVHYDTPPRGLMKAIHFRPTELAPEPWVPPDVVSYTTVNFGLGDLLTTIDEIVGAFLPGGALAQAQTLLNAQGIDLDLKREVVTPIGRRITVVSDFATPGDGATERTVFAMALNDAKTFDATLAKVAPLTGGSLKSRDFQGRTLYEFTLPAGLFPGVGDGAAAGAAKIGICVAESHLFVASDTSFLEKLLLNAAAQKSKLTDTPAFKQIARHLPAEAGGISFTRTAEQYRVLYAALKSGAVADSLRDAVPFLPESLSRLARAFDGANLPDFEVIQHYLGTSGMYMTTDEDGLMIVQFQLRPEGP